MKKRPKTIAVIGGDLRSAAAANAFCEAGWQVRVFLTDPNGRLHPAARMANTLGEALEGADAALLPMPVSADGETVRNTGLSLREVICSACPVYYCGKAGETLYACAKQQGCRIVDYASEEELSIRNAVPTAEGAILIALRETAVTLSGSRCLITGFGRIGKVLAHKLSALGAQVVCAARNPLDRAWCEALGYGAQELSCLDPSGFTVIFNTVPVPIFGAEELAKTDPETVLIELASLPGGIDLAAAETLGRRAISAPGLPGKIAPLTAGRIITETVLRMTEQSNQ